MNHIEKISRLKEEISKVIIGKEQEVELLAVALLFNGHVLLESVPGTGKTMLAKSFAKTIDGEFSRIQFTPDVLPSDVTGIQFFNPKEQEFELRPGPIVTNVLLADEINRATPRTQSSLLEVMEERQVTIDGHTIALKEPFIVIATQNPVESQQGTFPLPLAQLDRFFIKMQLGYPSFDEERALLSLHRGEGSAPQVSCIINRKEIKAMKAAAQNVRISDDIETYLLEIVRKSREHQAIELGVSPRGAIALMKAAQGKAYIQGREFVVPNDIKEMASFVLGHRIILSTEATLTKTTNHIIKDLLESTSVPVEEGF
ncbi:MoxR family ATPase [Cytobacillus spongiae]|jgi:MoxR-like ATPase|uniref:AAA family ATPase n=1 Tax=Cytobacillus spongiae TaxID=2901381 RepID=UPI001F3488F4|nr:MoxR family ATPase [Cytobacillus spongiae]UII57198.1 MoxR family ATPase [Cytobacillus spongiae]